MVMGTNRQEASSRETSLGFEWNRVNIISIFKLINSVKLYYRSEEAALEWPVSNIYSSPVLTACVCT